MEREVLKLSPWLEFSLAQLSVFNLEVGHHRCHTQLVPVIFIFKSLKHKILKFTEKPHLS
jgi:hypothetical protein